MGVYEYLERGLVSHVKVDRLDVNYNKQVSTSGGVLLYFIFSYHITLHLGVQYASDTVTVV